jgi:hypothetical protein
MLPPGVTDASYTQWEFYFARHFRRRLSIYIATDAWQPDRPAPAGDRADLQAALLAHIVDQQGLDRDYFGTVDRLCHLVLKEDWPKEKLAKPTLLPYASLGDLFIGRDDDLVRLHDSLNRSAGAAITSSALLGLGGMGKTRLAVEYAARYADDYTALLFAIAETPDDLHRNLAALTGVLGLRALNAADDATRLQGVLDRLGNNPGWLLILDNVDSTEAAEAVGSLMGRLRGGRVLLTSRLASVPAEFARLDLDLLAPDDAAGFMLRRTAGRRRIAPGDATDAAALAKDLGYLALALEQAGAYIAAAPLRMSLADYRALLRDSFAEVMEWSDPLVTHYPRAVAATWQTSVAKLDAAARALLERLAFLAPDPVPATLLDVAAPGVGPDEARRGLRGLATYLLISGAADGHSFTVHRLMQDVTRREMEAAGTARERLTEALGWVSAAFVGDPQDVRSWPVLDPLTPHADAVAAHADAARIVDPTARLMSRMGVLLLAKALHARAEPLMRRALAIGEARLGNDHPTVAIRLNNLAALLQATNRLGEAEPLMRRALAINEASLGKDDPNVATDLNNLGGLLRATNRLGEAEPLMCRALAIDEASLGKDHPTVARDLSNLASLLQDTNRLGEAELLMRRALAIDETSLGKGHPSVARDLNNLAALLRDTSRLGEAEPLLRRALAITEASLGNDHPNVATALSNLAELLRTTNRLGEAEPLMRRALAIDETSLGKHHPNFATALNNLAQLLQDASRPGEAEPLLRRALAISEASYGKDHPDVANRLINLAALLQATNRLGDAEPLMRRALAIYEASYGKDHPTVAIALNNLARLLQDTNRLGEAEPLMRRHLAIFLAFQHDTGHAHPHRDAAIANYAGLLAAMGRSGPEIDAALAALRREARVDQG